MSHMEERLLIPISNGEVVVVTADELPDDPGAMVRVLLDENVPLEFWRRVAVAYYRMGKMTQFEKILTEAVSREEATAHLESKSERIATLNTLAAHHIAQISSTMEKHQKEFHFAEATRLINRVEKIDVHFEVTWVLKGMLLIARNEFESALSRMEAALTANKNSIPAMLGVACLKFQKGEYQAALEQYSNILKANPSCPARVRLGIGLCCYRMNHLDRARLAFERTLELDPQCAEAFVGLALLAINNTNLELEARIRKGMELLEKAFAISKTNAMILSQLCDYFFFKNDLEKVRKLSHSAQSNTQSHQIKAEAIYKLARTYHIEGEYDMAATYYKQSISKWDSFVLPHFGFGQMKIAQHDIRAAIAAFEKVEELAPNNMETPKILGALYAYDKRYEKAREKLQRATELQPDDDDCWVELAHMFEKHDPQTALDAYEKALKLQNVKGKEIPTELWNNIGCLRYRVGKWEEAQNAYEKALQLARDRKQSTITITYNLARLFEQRRQLQKAKTLYQEILQEHPDYVDCHLRLGVIARDAGDIEGALEAFKEASTTAPKNPDGWTLWGNLHLDREEWESANKLFDRVLTQIDKEDSYTMLCKSRVLYQSGRAGGVKPAHLQKALQFSRQVLSRDLKNVYAANTCGALMCELGYSGLGSEVFSQVREAATEMPDVFVNLAHLALNSKDQKRAIGLYESCLKRFFNNHNVHLLQLIAYAHFEAEEYSDSVRVMTSALHIEPFNNDIRYNLAVAQYHLAQFEIKKKSLSTLTTNSAQRALTQALRFFKFLQQDSCTLSQSKDAVTTYIEKCKVLSDKVDRVSRQAEERERKIQELREKELRETQLALQAKQREQEARRLQQAEEAAKLEKRIREQTQKQEQFLNTVASESQNVQHKPTKRKHKETGLENEVAINLSRHAADRNSDESEPGSPANNSSSSDDERPRKLRKRKNSISDNDSERTPSPSKEILKRAGLDSDSD